MNEWAIIFIRYGFAAAAIFLYYLYLDRGNVLKKIGDAGWWGVLAGSFKAVASITYVLALLNTHVANVMIILSLNSIFASIFSYFLYDESIPLRMTVTILVVVTAVCVVVSLELTNDFDDAWFGNIMAIVSSFFNALYFSVVRGINRGRSKPDQIDFITCLVFSNIIVMITSASFGAFDDDNMTSISGSEWGFLFLQGALLVPYCTAVLTWLATFISSPEIGLFLLLDLIFEPVWVYLAGLDTAPYYAIYSGIVVVIALGTNAYLAIQEQQSKYTEILDNSLAAEQLAPLTQNVDSDDDKDV